MLCLKSKDVQYATYEVPAQITVIFLCIIWSNISSASQ